jgi:hypothetical protein
VTAAEIYDPAKWHDFFVMVGGAAAALTGLVFVAMTLSLHIIAEDATHRYRAIGTLAGLTASFMLCALALMGGVGHVGLGVEWAVMAGVGAAVYVAGYVLARRTGGSAIGLALERLVTGTTLYVAQIAGAVMIICGVSAGLYLAAVSMVLLFGFAITGAWLLIVGVWQHPHDTSVGHPMEPGHH